MSDYMGINEAARFLGVSIQTLRKWEKQQKIKTYRNPLTKRRLYIKEDLENVLKDIK